METSLVFEGPFDPVGSLLCGRAVCVLNEHGDGFSVGSKAAMEGSMSRIDGSTFMLSTYLASVSMVVMSAISDSLVAVSLSTDSAILRQTARATLSHYARHGSG